MLPRLACALALLGVSLHAHDAGLSTARAVLGRGHIDVTVAYAIADLRALLPGYGGPQAPVSAPERAQLEEISSVLCALRIADRSVPPASSSLEVIAGDNVTFRFSFPCPAGTTAFDYEAVDLRSMPAAQRELFQAFDQGGALLAEKLLSPGSANCRVPVAPAATIRPPVPAR